MECKRSPQVDVLFFVYNESFLKIIFVLVGCDVSTKSTYIELLVVSLMQSHIKAIEIYLATSGGLIFQTFRNVPDGVN